MHKNKRTLLKIISLLPFIGINKNSVASIKEIPNESKEFILNNLSHTKLTKSNEINIYNIDKGKKIKTFGPFCINESYMVTVYVDTALQNVKSISIFLEKPQLKRLAKYNFFGNSKAYIASRYKIIKKSNLVAVVETDNGLYFSSTFIKSGVLCCY